MEADQFGSAGCRPVEEHFDIAVQMIEAGGGNVRTLLGFRENEGSLNDGLGVEREASGGPLSLDAVLAHGFGDVGLERCGVPADALVAGFADGRVGLIHFLNHGSDEAGEVGQIALEDGLAEIDVGEEAVEGIGEELIGSGCEEAAGDAVPVVGGGERELFLALEVMEEAAFGEAGGLADVLDACCRVAFGADDVEGGVEQLLSSIRGLFGGAFIWVPTN